jgi:hypothetical protein
MTIATRNRFIRLATGFSLIMVVFSIAFVALILVRGGGEANQSVNRPISMLSGVGLTRQSNVAALLAIVVYPIFSLVSLGYILFAFEKTQTIEITFFAACAFAASFEAFRLFIPYYTLWNDSEFYSITITRISYFAKFTMLLFLLSSGIFTTGQTSQQLGPSIFLLAFISLSLANVVPVDTSTISSVFMVAPGYARMLNLFFLLLGALCWLTYMILGRTKGAREYSFSAWGILAFLAGYAVLSVCDSWLFLACGSVCLFWGASIYLRKMHQYYLWQ